jgi:hypothetical protein
VKLITEPTFTHSTGNLHDMVFLGSLCIELTRSMDVMRVCLSLCFVSEIPEKMSIDFVSEKRMDSTFI